MNFKSREMFLSAKHKKKINEKFEKKFRTEESWIENFLLINLKTFFDEFLIKVN